MHPHDSSKAARLDYCYPSFGARSILLLALAAQPANPLVVLLPALSFYSSESEALYDGLLMQPSLSFSSSQGLRLVARLPHMPQSASSLSVSHPSTRQARIRRQGTVGVATPTTALLVACFLLASLPLLATHSHHSSSTTAESQDSRLTRTFPTHARQISHVSHRVRRKFQGN